MEQHHGSHIDIVHHSIDHVIDESISISSSVHQLSRIDQHEFSDIDSAICSNHHHSTNVSERIDSNIHCRSRCQSISVSTMATEHRWRNYMGRHHGSDNNYIDSHGSFNNRISSNVHQYSRSHDNPGGNVESNCSNHLEPADGSDSCCAIECNVLGFINQSIRHSSMATDH